MIDPITAISTISSGLNLVDKFTDIVRKLRREKPKPFSVEASQEGDALVIKRRGVVAEKIDANNLHLNKWDEVRYSALEKKVYLVFGQFNDLDSKLPTLAVDERVRIEQKMELMRQDLCKDFHEMIDIYENTLGVGLDDHYSLFQTCK
jgi:hypothetical protein